ncbi:hypothetical protein ACFVWY_16225 [Streptomyces sp. NPDC058195]|uniref:hypothetical protein n=1 Tax=Streptomyces sp. NPDC058195 TaxID=3346375 RepID=UPI0036E988B3
MVEGSGRGQVGHEVGDVGDVGEVAGGGERAQAADGGSQVLVFVADGVVEGKGELHEAVEEGESGGLDVAVKVLGAGGDAAGSGVLDQGDDLGEEGVGALVEAGQELVGEGELVAGPGGVGEGEGQGEQFDRMVCDVLPFSELRRLAGLRACGSGREGAITFLAMRLRSRSRLAASFEP